MTIIENPNRKEWPKLLERPVMDLAEIEGKVKPILEAIKKDGDKAVKAFTARFDKAEIDDLLVSQYEIEQAVKKVPLPLQEAIRLAKSNIEKFHIVQKELVRKVETMEGVTCWRKSVPIAKVGLYIPGGTAPLFSSVLMLGVPAKLAGCNEIVLCTPPDPSGHIHPAILFTANLVGIRKIYKVGGAQAIAAMAYGTESIPSVSKIFGPGNQYVTIAKQMVAREAVAIDLPAGPSEVAVLADQTAHPDFVAADLLSQAEHGADSQVVLITTSSELLDNTQKALASQLERLPRKTIAEKALANSTAFLMPDMDTALDLTNAYAAEHLIIASDEAAKLAEKITDAGSVFIGHFTPESAGDYASGTNHTLPTNGYARNYSGVSLDSFFRKITFQEISPTGVAHLGPIVEKMAEAEELFAHKNAMTLRMEYLDKKGL